MKFCPINLQPVSGDGLYSKEGLAALHPKLIRLATLQLSHEEQLREARLRADKMSVQGVQPKLSAVLRIAKGELEVVDNGGQFLLKPNPSLYQEVPANEALTMTLAKSVGIEVPPHGIVSTIDDSWVYLIRRFDRTGRRGRIHVEDFAQLSGATRETKYDSSLERVAKIIETHCTFPEIEKAKLARRLIFCFLTGNEDMHLKNFSLWLRGGSVTLAPAYDLLNSTLVLENATEESALPLQGKKKNLSRKLWFDYFCKECLGLPEEVIEEMQCDFSDAWRNWKELIDRSFLSPARKEAYIRIVTDRVDRLQL